MVDVASESVGVGTGPSKGEHDVVDSEAGVYGLTANTSDCNLRPLPRVTSDCMSAPARAIQYLKHEGNGRDGLDNGRTR